MIELFLAAAAMAVKDCFATLLVVAESRGRYWVAATLDALGDLANVGVTLYGAGLIIEHGWSAHTVSVLAVMMVTSFAGTAFWTKMACRWMPADSYELAIGEIHRRLRELEAACPHQGFYKNSHRV